MAKATQSIAEMYAGSGIRSAAANLILLSVLKRIHCGMGLFCLAFLANFLLMRNVFWDGCKERKECINKKFDNSSQHRTHVQPLSGRLPALCR